MGTTWIDGYSSHVELYLVVNEQRISVAQVGPDSFILQEPVEIAPETDAELVIRIDGREKRLHVFLQQGASSDRAQVQFI